MRPYAILHLLKVGPPYWEGGRADDDDDDECLLADPHTIILQQCAHRANYPIELLFSQAANLFLIESDCLMIWLGGEVPKKKTWLRTISQ